MKISRLILAAAVAVAFTAPAQAQIVNEAYVPAEAVFGGIRAEGQVGYDRNSYDLKVSTEAGTPFTTASVNSKGASFGAELGYDVQINRVVFGSYVGGEYSTAELCSEVYGTDELCFKSKRNLNVGARLGFAFAGDALVYAKGGYSNGRVSVEYTDFAYDESVRAGVNRDGFHVGAGVEFPIGRFYVKGEYLHVNYSKYRIDTATFIDASRDQGRFGIGYRF
ncbi:outer membrane protein [Sphingomonas sp. 3-13AW]|uniref:outer membrane protein n=1 Tax=Sphingomonas sp. 3-13AW TaxID=3050450 RepID=UPI003BB4A7A0